MPRRLIGPRLRNRAFYSRGAVAQRRRMYGQRYPLMQSRSTTRAYMRPSLMRIRSMRRR